MSDIIIPKKKVLISEGWSIKPEMVVLMRLYMKLSPKRDTHCADIRIMVCPKSEAEKGTIQGMLYINSFDMPLLTELRGNVTLPISELLEKDWEDVVTDNTTKLLRLILGAELQEILFDLGGEKNTCSIWFGCMKSHPKAIIPKSELLNYFTRTK